VTPCLRKVISQGHFAEVIFPSSAIYYLITSGFFWASLSVHPLDDQCTPGGLSVFFSCLESGGRWLMGRTKKQLMPQGWMSRLCGKPREDGKSVGRVNLLPACFSFSSFLYCMWDLGLPQHNMIMPCAVDTVAGVAPTTEEGRRTCTRIRSCGRWKSAI